MLGKSERDEGRIIPELFDLVILLVDAMDEGILSTEELKEVAAAMRPVTNMIRKKKTG